MDSTGGDELVEFLLEETGDHLHLVLQYDADAWEPLYMSDIADEVIAEAGADLNDLLDAFRREGRQNARLNALFGLDGYYCSLHLFGELVLLHFGQPDRRGIVFGYAPIAASHLTDFVAVTLPYIRRAGLEELDEAPSWASP